MSINITGHDPNQATWPVNNPVQALGGITRPTGDALVGGTFPTVLNGGTDANYINEKTANAYYRIIVVPGVLPLNARITSCYGWARVRRHASNTKYPNFLVGLGDSSKPTGGIEDISSKWSTPSLTAFTTYTGPSITKNGQGQPLSQVDINNGMYLLMGGNAAYGANTSTTGWDISQGGMKVTYDLPPTANITSPASGTTFSTTASPIVAWDYFDDFQTQDSYQVTVYDAGNNLVYDSGKVSSSDTFHTLSKNLSNGSYTAYVMVWQAWTTSTVPFPATAAASTTFTINLLPLSTPRLTITPNASAGNIPANAYAKVACYPDINLISYNASTFENNTLEWLTLVGCTVKPDKTTFRDGSQSCKVSISASAAGLFQSKRVVEVDVGPNSNTYKAQIYANPGATTGAKCQLTLNFYDGNGALLGSTSGAQTTLAASAYTQVTVSGALNPAVSGSVFISGQVNLTTVASGNVVNLDSYGIWCEGGSSALPVWTRGGFFESTPNLLQYADSAFETGATSWSIVPSGTNNGITGVNFATPPTAQGGVEGSKCLLLSGVTVTGANSAVIGTAGVLPCTAGTTYWMGFACLTFGGAGGSFSAGLAWFDKNMNSLTGSSVLSFTSVTGAWQPSGVNNGSYSMGSAVAPSGAVYMQPQISVNTSNLTDTRYIDAVAVYSGANFPGQVFLRGQLPLTDNSPELIFQYSNDGGVIYNDIVAFATTPNQEYYEYDDFTIPSSGSHAYRTYLTETENGLYMQSPYSASGSSSSTVSHVFMHADSSPSGTFYPFSWDGGGRGQSDDMLVATVDVDGLQYPFAQFPEESSGSIDVSLHLDNASDIAAWQMLRLFKGEIVFRDQRGRCARGVLNSVKTTDAPYGVAQEVQFTLVLTGNQP